jgi:hypothetical protein
MAHGEDQFAKAEGVGGMNIALHRAAFPETLKVSAELAAAQGN